MKSLEFIDQYFEYLYDLSQHTDKVQKQIRVLQDSLNISNIIRMHILDSCLDYCYE